MTWGTNLPKPIWRETPADPLSPLGKPRWNKNTEPIVSPDGRDNFNPASVGKSLERQKLPTWTWIGGGLFVLVVAGWSVSIWVRQEVPTKVNQEVPTEVNQEVQTVLLFPDPKRNSPVTTYQVKAGDTLGGIAQHFYGDWSKWPLIAKANTITNPRALPIGIILAIPQDQP